ncbi:hypothetical protein N3K66_003341 [Trichothecium roseum]|uniref:Uncharacterized protein n=1 Tax=Trichothecium roseum TaxID=47278 RepID=A0ACC0V519_9HYPO|nr:hypothetical protein N3K66_003341 [Trichothecium roseum]
MSDRRETRRLPKGERCSHCGDRKYYIENGMRFCAANGHEIEGFIQFDVGEEEDAGLMGAVTRRKKEVREREKKQLTGQAGKNLYLEALQLILRNQVLWLVSEKGFRVELETVIRDLWDLRIRGFGTLQPDMDAPEDRLEMFSSQPIVEKVEPTLGLSPRTESWDPDTGIWQLPRMSDTLALCYLGSLLLRIPLSIGRLFLLADSGNIPYKRCYYDLPEEMRDRMPSHFTQVLKLPLQTTLRGNELHNAVLQLILAYHYNYALNCPPLQHSSLLVHYGKLLALPVEIFQTTRFLASNLEISFEYPIHKSRVYPMDHPEILLVSLLVVSAKLCFPFKEADSESKGFRWSQWASQARDSIELTNANSRDLRPDGLKDITADQVVSMNDTELNKYLGFVSSFTDNRSDSSLTTFFPSIGPPEPEPLTREPSENETSQRAISILTAAIDYTGDSTDGKRETFLHTSNYNSFSTPEDLSGVAREFYEVAAKTTGIQLQTLVRAVYTLEQRIMAWQRGHGA